MLTFFPPPALPGSGSNGRRSLNRHLSRVKPSSRLSTPITRPPIINLLLDLQKNNYADSTTKSVRKNLEKLAQYCDLNKHDEVKTFLATFDRSNNYKRILANNYDLYLKTYDLKLEETKYHQTAKTLKISLESQIDSLIAFTSSKLAIAMRAHSLYAAHTRDEVEKERSRKSN